MLHLTLPSLTRASLLCVTCASSISHAGSGLAPVRSDLIEPSPVAGRIVPDSDFNPVENSVGVAIENLCPSLVRRSNTGINSPDSAERDLQVRCTEAVQARGNGVVESDLQGVLRAVTAEEAATQGTSLVELSAVRTAAVLARLVELRTASAGEVFAYDEHSGKYRFAYNRGGSAGDGDFGRWSVYLNGGFATGDRDETANESGFDFDSASVSAGVDYRAGANVFVGANFSYLNAQADLDNGGELDADGVDITLYVTAYRDSGLFIEATAGLGSSDYDQERRIRYTVPGVGGAGTTSVSQTAIGDTDGDQFTASLGLGKDFSRGSNTISLTAYLRYLDADVDGFRETLSDPNAAGFGLGLEVDEQQIESLQSIIGVQVSRAISRESGVLSLYGHLDWIHEFENDVRETRARFLEDPFTTTGITGTTTFSLTTDAPDEDYFRIGGGLSNVWQGGWLGFLAVDALLGLRDINSYLLSAGVRKEL